MRTIQLSFAAAIVAGSFMIAPIASAAVISAPPAAAAGEAGIITKVHDWHRNCEWGPVRFHRHISGVGNVPCESRRPVRRWCHGWRSECGARWGWGNWEYRRCLRRHGC